MKRKHASATLAAIAGLLGVVAFQTLDAPAQAAPGHAVNIGDRMWIDELPDGYEVSRSSHRDHGSPGDDGYAPPDDTVELTTPSGATLFIQVRAGHFRDPGAAGSEMEARGAEAVAVRGHRGYAYNTDSPTRNRGHVRTWLEANDLSVIVVQQGADAYAANELARIIGSLRSR